MAKQPIYHLDECNDCAHRHVCKYLDKIDKLLKRGDLPLDLQGASCHEYIPEDVIDEDWKDYMGDEEPENSITFTTKFMGTDHNVFEGLKNSLQSQFFNNEEPLNPTEVVEGLNYGIFQVQQQGLKVSAVYMNRATMDALKPAFGTDKDLVSVLLTNGDKVPLYVDNTIETGMFAIEILH
jgi:hypothetical protein